MCQDLRHHRMRRINGQRARGQLKLQAAQAGEPAKAWRISLSSAAQSMVAMRKTAQGTSLGAGLSEPGTCSGIRQGLAGTMAAASAGAAGGDDALMVCCLPLSMRTPDAAAGNRRHLGAAKTVHDQAGRAVGSTMHPP